MRILKISFALMTAAMLSLTGCNERPGSTILAKVNGVNLTLEDLNFQQQEPHGSKPQYGPKSVEDIINQELLSQQGVRLGLDQDPSFRQKLVAYNATPGAKRLELARRVFNTEIASKVDVSYQEGKQYFEQNADQIATELHLMLARFDKREEAEAAVKKLRQGADFAAVARTVMKEAPADGREPWDMGFVKWQQVPIDFADPIYRLHPGEVSDVLGSQRTGFQIVKLLEKRKTPAPQYQEVSATVMNRLRDLKLLKGYQQYLATLRKEAKIVTF